MKGHRPGEETARLTRSALDAEADARQFAEDADHHTAWAAQLPLLSALLEELGGVSRAGFLARVTTPHLVVQAGTVDDLGSNAFFTLAGGPSELQRASGPRLEKRVGPGSNPFGQMITLGRARNNDLVLLHPSVSKFHAWFSQEGGTWTVTDAGSSNGTWLDGQRLTARQSHRLRAGATLVLADALRVQFLLPEDLLAMR